LLVDPKFSGYRAGRRLARALSWLLPKPDLVFSLDSEPDVLGHRTNEGALVDEVQRVLRAYMLERSTATLRYVQNPSVTFTL